MKTVEQNKDQYMIKMELIRGSHSLFNIQGPVMAVITPYTTKFKTDININNQQQLTTIFNSDENNQVVLIQLEKQQQPIFTIKWNVKTGLSQGGKANVKVFVPRMIDSDIDILITENVMHTSTNTLLLPSTDAARRIKAFTDLNLDSQQWQADLSWDADRDRSKKISIQAQFMKFSMKPLQVVIQ